MQRPSNHRKHVAVMARGADQNKQIMGMVGGRRSMFCAVFCGFENISDFTRLPRAASCRRTLGRSSTTTTHAPTDTPERASGMGGAEPSSERASNLTRKTHAESTGTLAMAALHNENKNLKPHFRCQGSIVQ
jgi:hypothetical protein